jgi:hypothetical protein
MMSTFHKEYEISNNDFLYLKTLTVDHPAFDNGKLYHGRMDCNSKFYINV